MNKRRTLQKHKDRTRRPSESGRKCKELSLHGALSEDLARCMTRCCCCCSRSLRPWENAIQADRRNCLWSQCITYKPVTHTLTAKDRFTSHMGQHSCLGMTFKLRCWIWILGNRVLQHPYHMPDGLPGIFRIGCPLSQCSLCLPEFFLLRQFSVEKPRLSTDGQQSL